MFGRKKGELKDGDFVFTSRPDGDYSNIIFGSVTGIDGDRIGVNGFLVNPVGLKNKISQGKAGPRSTEILKDPSSDNCIMALIYRIEHENFTGVLDLGKDKVEIIPPRVFAILDGWIRESLTESVSYTQLTLPTTPYV